MGAKTWMLVYADVDARDALKSLPPIDLPATQRLAEQLFRGEKLTPMEDGDLSDTSPPENEVCIGCFPGVSVVAAKEFGIDYPSRLPRRFIAPGGRGRVQLHAMHSVVDWFAFAEWTNGKLSRSLSLSPDSGILEDIGAKLPFEVPYWNSQHPAVDGEVKDTGYPFPFHPLELGEVALAAMFGYQLEGGDMMSTLIEPESIPLLRFSRSRPWWKVWR